MLIILSIIPLLIWVFMTPLALRFGSFSQGARSLGQITALLGMVLFSINLILSARLKIFDKYFKGLGNLYSKHHLIGGISFCLLLFHPLFLFLSYLRNLNRPDILLGIVGLSLMIIALIITFYLKLKYHIWKITHKLLGISFMFAFFHLLKVTSDVSQNPFLMFYIAGISSLGIIAYFYRSIFGDYLVDRFNYFVKSVKKLNKDYFELILEPGNRRLVFDPGKYVFIKSVNSKVSDEEHPFSLASSPKDRNIKLVIKSSGDYTRKLNLLEVGTKVELEGPFGTFSPKFTKEDDYIFIAGGVGITPFLSILDGLKEIDKVNIDFYYSVHNEDEIIYKDKLQKNKSVNLFLNISSKSGRLSADFIEKRSNGFIGKKIYICGPVKMIGSLKRELIKKGVWEKDIISEEFSF